MIAAVSIARRIVPAAAVSIVKDNLAVFQLVNKVVWVAMTVLVLMPGARIMSVVVMLITLTVMLIIAVPVVCIVLTIVVSQPWVITVSAA